MNDKLLFIDVETTGNQDEDRLCQVAYQPEGLSSPYENLYKPPLPIKIEASAVNHITNRMVEKCYPFIGSEMHAVLSKHFHEEDYILVAHNAEFEMAMLAKEGIKPRRFICTMKVARGLDTEDTIPNYKLQYLRYAWDIEIDAGAHNASDDVLVLEEVYKRLAARTDIETMLKLSAEPFLLRKLTFGKYKGESFKTIPRDYLIWLRRQDNITGDLLYTLNYYLNRAVMNSEHSF